MICELISFIKLFPFEYIYPRKLPIYQNSNLGDKELVQALILDAEITKVFTEETSRLD